MYGYGLEYDEENAKEVIKFLLSDKEIINNGYEILDRQNKIGGTLFDIRLPKEDEPIDLTLNKGVNLEEVKRGNVLSVYLFGTKEDGSISILTSGKKMKTLEPRTKRYSVALDSDVYAIYYYYSNSLIEHYENRGYIELAETIRETHEIIADLENEIRRSVLYALTPVDKYHLWGIVKFKTNYDMEYFDMQTNKKRKEKVLFAIKLEEHPHQPLEYIASLTFEKRELLQHLHLLDGDDFNPLRPYVFYFLDKLGDTIKSFYGDIKRLANLVRETNDKLKEIAMPYRASRVLGE